MQMIDRLNATDPPSPPGAWRQRPTSRLSLLVAAAMAAALLAGCGGGSRGVGVAHVNTSTSSNRSTKSTPKPSAVAFSQCMRAHGVQNFPDPNSSGQILITPAVNLDSSAYQTAGQDCKSLNPQGQETSNEAASQQKQLAELLKFAVCMRAHGVPNMPDPGATQGGGTGFPVRGPADSTGFDPNTPAFRHAQQECGGFLGAGSAALPQPAGG